jgi:hypothetical protein
MDDERAAGFPMGYNPSLRAHKILLANSELASFCNIVATKKRDNLKNCPTKEFANSIWKLAYPAVIPPRRAAATPPRTPRSCV